MYTYFMHIVGRSEGDNVGARECDSEGADSNTSGRNTIAETHVDQTTCSSNAINRTVALFNYSRYTVSSAYGLKFRLLIQHFS